MIRLPRPAATVFVADPEVADVQAQSPSIVYLFGRRAGETSLYAVDEDDGLLLRTHVVVQHNLSGLRRAVQQLLPSSQVTVTTVDGSIVVDGMVDSPVQAQELRELAGRYLGEEETLLYRVKVASPTQVHLRVRVAEVSRDVLKEFGINWEAIFQTGDFTFGLVSGRGVTDGAGQFPARARGRQQRVRQLATAATTSSIPRSTRSPRRAWSTSWPSPTSPRSRARPRASSPAASSRSRSTATRTALTIEFKEFGISLAFTPTVLSARADQPEGAPRGQRSVRQGRDQPQRPGHPRPGYPPGGDHGRARQRPVLRDRRPAVDRHREHA